MVTKALDVVSQAIDSMKHALKLMHGNTFFKVINDLYTFIQVVVILIVTVSEYVDPSIFYGIMRIFLSG